MIEKVFSGSFLLTVFSYGGGQDSYTKLKKYISDSAFRRRYGSEYFIVVMSDTADEHDETYATIPMVRKLCEEHGIPFFFLHADMGYHKPSWRGLIQAQKRAQAEGHAMIVQLGTKSCTANLKLDPIYKFLDEWINETFGFGFKINPVTRGCGKKAIKQFHKQYGKIRVLIGFARGEEGRAERSKKLEAAQHAKRDKKGEPIWEAAIVREFPLIDLGMDRNDCQAYLLANGGFVPPPSNCMRCPYISPQELLWLYRFARPKYDEWVEIEAGKIERFKPMEGKPHPKTGKPMKNHGVFNSAKLLPQKLAEAQAKYGHWTDAQLHEYKHSHGHCVKSAY